VDVKMRTESSIVMRIVRYFMDIPIIVLDMIFSPHTHMAEWRLLILGILLGINRHYIMSLLL
jgi:hypothetical protein